MRTTLNNDDELLEWGRLITGVEEEKALVQAGLEPLIAKEAAKRLAALGGLNPNCPLLRAGVRLRWPVNTSIS